MHVWFISLLNCWIILTLLLLLPVRQDYKASLTAIDFLARIMFLHTLSNNINCLLYLLGDFDLVVEGSRGIFFMMTINLNMHFFSSKIHLHYVLCKVICFHMFKTGQDIHKATHTPKIKQSSLHWVCVKCVFLIVTMTM